MKNMLQCVVSLSAAGLACTAGLLYSGVASADEHVLVLMDRTGSMGAQSIPGKTRLQVAKERINSFLESTPSQPRRYAFWTFDGTSYTSVHSFAQNKTKAEIKTAVNAVTLGGTTPLARSVCAAVDELMAFLPNEWHTKRIYMATDGEENSTPSTDQCYGFSSATAYPNLQQNSWQWKVRNKACTGDANSPAQCGNPNMPTLIIDIDHLYDYVSFKANTSLELGMSFQSFTLSPSGDAAFFGGLAAQTGGAYMAITPSTPPSQAAPRPGDANLDGCVNITDRSLVLAQYGQTVPAGTPTDFNRDHVVNVYDYNTVLQNFGSGCGAAATP